MLPEVKLLRMGAHKKLNRYREDSPPSQESDVEYMDLSSDEYEYTRDSDETQSYSSSDIAYVDDLKDQDYEEPKKMSKRKEKSSFWSTFESGGNDDAIFVRLNNTQLTYHDFQDLRPRTWLNDAIIYAALEHIQMTFPNIGFLPVRFSSAVHIGKVLGIAPVINDANRYNFDAEKLFVPIQTGRYVPELGRKADHHWTSIHVDNRLASMDYYNSMAVGNQEMAMQYLHWILKWMNDWR